jgi:RNA polymerase sigma-70 factor, ECF subfamily
MEVSAAELFRCHHLAIYRFVLRMTGRVDVAEDVTQDVFVRVVRGLGGYDHQGRELAWLLAIARNLLVDRHRRLQREPAVPLEDDVQVNARIPERAALVEALGRLPEPDREVFVLRAVTGLGHEDIARVVGATPAAVRCRIYRARTALRSMLGGANGRGDQGGSEGT